MPRLKDMVGDDIFVSMATGGKFKKMKLVAVEFGGIWVESEELTADFVSASELKMLLKTPVLLLPYARLGAIIGALEKTAIGEKALGLH